MTESHHVRGSPGKYQVTVTPIPYYSVHGDMVAIPAPIVSTADYPGSETALTPTIVDANPLKTFTAEVAEWDGDPSNIKSLLIDWGDGTTSAGVISSHSIQGTHQYSYLRLRTTSSKFT